MRTFFVILMILVSGSIFGQTDTVKLTKSVSKYRTWEGKCLPVFMLDNNELVVRYPDKSLKPLVKLVAEELKKHPCRHRDGFRAASRKNQCIYHLPKGALVKECCH